MGPRSWVLVSRVTPDLSKNRYRPRPEPRTKGMTPPPPPDAAGCWTTGALGRTAVAPGAAIFTSQENRPLTAAGTCLPFRRGVVFVNWRGGPPDQGGKGEKRGTGPPPGESDRGGLPLDSRGSL